MDIKQKQIDLYREGYSAYKIANFLGIGTTSIYRYLKQNNVKARKIRKYNFNESIFDNIDTQEKQYWLGYIYQDGYISKNSDKKPSLVGIKSIDKEHLVKFKKFLNAQQPIKKCVYGKNSYKPGQTYYSIKISSIILQGDLLKHGVFLNKSLILKEPKIDITFYQDFIRGYIDGDGSITRYLNSSKQYYQYKLHILGTYDILDFIRKNLPQKNIVSISKKKNSKIYSIQFGGNKNLYNILNFLYSNATCYLERKYSLYKQFMAQVKQGELRERE